MHKVVNIDILPDGPHNNTMRFFTRAFAILYHCSYYVARKSRSNGFWRHAVALSLDTTVYEDDAATSDGRYQKILSL